MLEIIELGWIVLLCGLIDRGIFTIVCGLLVILYR
jgi:hypothetical protein